MIAREDKAASADIAGADRANQRRIVAEKTQDARAVAKQQRVLNATTADQRSWHAATRDQTIDEYIKPDVAAQAAGSRAMSGLAGAATATATVKAHQPGVDAKHAQMAQLVGGFTAGTLAVKAELTALDLEAEGHKLIERENARSAATDHALVAESAKQGARVETQATIATNEMKMHAGLAHGRMEVERANLASLAGTAAGSAHGAMTAETAAAKSRAGALQRETADKMRATTAREKAQIDAKVAKLLADLAATPDKNLARQRTAIARDLAALDTADRAASGAIHTQAVGAERTIEREDAGHRVRIHAQATRARAAIEKVAREARKRIVAANKPTERDIAGAATRGREAIGNVGSDANKSLVTFSEQRLNLDNAFSDLDQKLFDVHAQGAATQLGAMASGVASSVDQAWLDDAMTGAKDLDGMPYVGPTGTQATAGMRAITALPPKLQGDAIKKLSDSQFRHLLERVPEGNREELEALVQNTSDPQRKLELWGVYHKAHAVADAKRTAHGSDPESQRRNAARLHAAADTAGEVDEEKQAMYLRVARTGKPFTEHDVNDLIQRKDTEHAMEMKYNIDFTNDGGTRTDGTHIHWSDDELKAFDKTLSRMPDAHLAGNAGIERINRQEKVLWNPSDPHSASLGGMAEPSKKDVLISDGGAGLAPFPGQHRELADPALGSNISWMEWIMTHELGHMVSAKYGALEQKYEQINGWKSYGATTGALTAAEKATIDAKRGNRFDQRASVDKGGDTYQVDQDSSGYLSHTQDALPVVAPGTPDKWAYAKTRGYEQFAEHYDLAMHIPQQVYADFVTDPHNQTVRLQQQVAAAPTPAARAQLLADLHVAQKAEQVRKQSYDLMRNDVFGTDKEQTQAEGRLAARGVTSARILQFKAEAAQASTPDQLHQIEKKY